MSKNVTPSRQSRRIRGLGIVPQRLAMSRGSEAAPSAATEAPTTASSLTGEIPSAPRTSIQQRDPAEEEDAYDRRCVEENAGASDSEEDPASDDDESLPNLEEQALSDEAKLTAELTDFVSVKVEGEEQQEPWCYGAPVGWKPPGPPDDWKVPEPKTIKGEPAAFVDIDNPGNWDEYSFQAKFDKKKKCVQHQLPTGVVPVPVNNEGKREISGWEFHYNGWTKPSCEGNFRDGASKENMFPQFRHGSLDQNILTRLGLNVQRMRDGKGEPDSLFFYQLLLPIHQINKSKGILPVPDDPRHSFYCDVAKWTNLHAVGELDLGSGHGHQFQMTTAAEMLQWDGSLVMDGVRGGSDSATLRRFSNYPDSKAYDPDISKAFTKSRWLELKRTVKLCNNLTSPKKGDEDYDPAYKCDFIFRTLFHNVNALSLHACPDQCGDETTFGHQGHGEHDAGLVKLIKNKPGITKGMQIAMMSDVDWIRPRSYLHRHKKHPKIFSQQGPNEVRLLWERQLLPLCAEDNLLGKALFQVKPHITWDNFFSGDEIMQHAAEEGFGLTMTCRRDRLPADVPKKYFHHAKTQVNPRTRAARFQRPIFAVKKHGQSYMQFTSFQSTSSCNVACVNALNSCSLYAQTKERGRATYKRLWAIEMNEASTLYLNTYGGIDRMDHLIKNCNMGYRSWKCWHSAMIHCKAMAVVVSYDIYLECCAGGLVPGWSTKPASFYRFREILAKQMLQCSPTDRKYPGDESMRACTQQNQKKRRLTMSSSSVSVPSTVTYKTATGVDREHLQQAEPRLCGFLDELLHHERSIMPLKNKGHHVCHCCGHPAYHICTACPGNPALHVRATKDHSNSCFLHYHNTASFGLWKEDFKVTGNKKKNWHYPTDMELEQSSKDMERLHLALCKESRATAASTDTIASGLTSEAVARDETWNDRVI